MEGLPEHHLLELLDLSAELAADSRLEILFKMLVLFSQYWLFAWP